MAEETVKDICAGAGFEFNSNQLYASNIAILTNLDSYYDIEHDSEYSLGRLAHVKLTGEKKDRLRSLLFQYRSWARTASDRRDNFHRMISDLLEDAADEQNAMCTECLDFFSRDAVVTCEGAARALVCQNCLFKLVQTNQISLKRKRDE